MPAHTRLSHTTILMGVIWCAFGRVGSAQLSALAIDPRVVVLSPRHPAGRLTVFNPRLTAAEYTVELRYGTITTNATGQPVVTLDDHPADSIATNATAWITTYPTKFILNPGSSQVIRLFAQSPRNTRDGEYWARIVVRARELVPPLPPRTPTDTSVRMNLSLETSTILPLFYRVGTPTTGVAIDSLFATRDGDSLAVHATLRRTGAAAYMGVATLSLEDTNSPDSAMHTQPPITTRKRIAIYSTITPQWRIPLTTTSHTPYRSGKKKLTLLLSTDRPDAPTGTIIRAPTVGQSLEITFE
jgi:P pilus assembly chaperone PapD